MVCSVQATFCYQRPIRNTSRNADMSCASKVVCSGNCSSSSMSSKVVAAMNNHGLVCLSVCPCQRHICLVLCLYFLLAPIPPVSLLFFPPSRQWHLGCVSLGGRRLHIDKYPYSSVTICLRTVRKHAPTARTRLPYRASRCPHFNYWMPMVRCGLFIAAQHVSS